jgi:Na+/phosphate symporter
VTNRRIDELRRRADDGASIFDVRLWSIERWIAVGGVVLSVFGFYFRMQSLEQRVADKFALVEAQIIDMRKDVKEELAKLQTRELSEAQRTALQKQIDDTTRRLESVENGAHGK